MFYDGRHIMEATDLAAQSRLCVYFDRILYRSDIFLGIAFQQLLQSAMH
jgi:hypothetical protein